MKRFTLFFAVATALTILASACRFHSNDPYYLSPYHKQIVDHRKSQDSFYRFHEASPFVVTQTLFKGLDYFEPDSTFCVPFELIVGNTNRIDTITDSKGNQRPMVVAGDMSFNLKGKLHRLTAYAIEGSHELFVMFHDQTNGKSTYKGGRYVEVDSQKGLIDFNYAYYPYCFYTEGYACPIVPKKESLDLAVEAGEKGLHYSAD